MWYHAQIVQNSLLINNIYFQKKTLFKKHLQIELQHPKNLKKSIPKNPFRILYWSIIYISQKIFPKKYFPKNFPKKKSLLIEESHEKSLK